MGGRGAWEDSELRRKLKGRDAYKVVRHAGFELRRKIQLDTDIWARAPEMTVGAMLAFIEQLLRTVRQQLYKDYRVPASQRRKLNHREKQSDSSRSPNRSVVDPGFEPWHCICT